MGLPVEEMGPAPPRAANFKPEEDRWAFPNIHINIFNIPCPYPNHDFILICARWSRASEQIKSDVSNNARAGVGPVPSDGNAWDGRQLLGSEFESSIGKRLDTARTACPGPWGLPSQGTSADGIYLCALRATSCSSLAPKILVTVRGIQYEYDKRWCMNAKSRVLT